MSSDQDAIGEPMDSQPEETNVVAQKADLPPISTVADKLSDPLPPMSRDAFTKVMQDFYDNSVAGVGGLTRQDLDYVVKSATATRHRVTDRNGVYFSDSSDRQHIIRKFYTRFLHEFNHKDELSRQKGQVRRLTSAQCWGFLQVADMAVMRQIETSMDASAMPQVFDESAVDLLRRLICCGG